MKAVDRVDVDEGTFDLVRLIRDVGGLNRPAIGERTGWARVTVNQRLERALAAGLLVSAGTASSSRGRPAQLFELNGDRAHVLLADIGASGMRLAAADLRGKILRRMDHRIAVADGPEPVLESVARDWEELRDPDVPVWGVGVSVPGPVEFATGTVVSPPIMSGWDGTSIPERLRERFGPVVFVDNDVNAMALGEQQTRYRDVADLLFVKIGTGIGAGIIANGRTLRGAHGAAGDIGHVRADAGRLERPVPLCRCGQLGCVEAYAGGWAILRDLQAAGYDVQTVDDVVAEVRGGDPLATRLVRDSGLVLGATVADAVGMLNPAVIVIGGQLSEAGEHLLAGVRERIYSRSLPLAMRSLRIEKSALAGDAGVLGLAHGLVDRLLTPPGLQQVLAAG